MKHILATAALSLMLTTSAFADAHSGSFNTYQAEQRGDIYASKFIGMRVYATEKDYDGLNNDTMMTQDQTKEWDDIGEVNDVILGRNGEVKAVILGIGGFIGIGEKDVAVTMNDIKLVNEKDEGDFFIVVKANKQSLTDAVAYKTAEVAKAAKEEVNETAAKVEETSKEAMDGARKMLVRPGVTREGYNEANMEEITTETLTGARVYGSNNEDIGEIDRLVVDTDGKIKYAIVDVGGFIGIGEHPIAVTMDELRILREDGGDDIRVYIDGTQAELEKQPKYEG